MTWLAGILFSGKVKMYSLAVAAVLLLLSLWHICGSGTGAPRKCRLLWLMVPFLCPALYPT